jgi:hypothetical protein
MQIRYLLILLSLQIPFSVTTHSQSTTNVVSRKIEKSFSISPKDKIYIQAEKGIIHLSQSQNNSLKVTLKLVVKNEDVAVAKKELEFIRYSLTQSGHEIRLQNYIMLSGKATELKSIVRAEYTIEVPLGSTLEIVNKFGLVEIENLAAAISSQVNYCDVHIDGLKGSLNLSIDMGDLVCKNSELKSEINTNFSEIQLENCTGSIDFKSKYGSINTILNSQLKRLKITSVKTNIVLINRMCQEYSFLVKAQFITVNFSKECYCMKAELIQQTGKGNSVDETQTIFYKPLGNLPLIEIEAKYGMLNLN